MRWATVMERHSPKATTMPTVKVRVTRWLMATGSGWRWQMD